MCLLASALGLLLLYHYFCFYHLASSGSIVTIGNILRMALVAADYRGPVAVNGCCHLASQVVVCGPESIGDSFIASAGLPAAICLRFVAKKSPPEIRAFSWRPEWCFLVPYWILSCNLDAFWELLPNWPLGARHFLLLGKVA